MASDVSTISVAPIHGKGKGQGFNDSDFILMIVISFYFLYLLYILGDEQTNVHRRINKWKNNNKNALARLGKKQQTNKNKKNKKV
jgi:hypothetical protein